jgi:adenylate cyclase class 2
MEEIEAKFLEVDIDKLKEKLKQNNAHFVASFDYKRKAYDFEDLLLAKSRHGWVRLRDEGDRVTLAYKERFGVKVNDSSISDEGMKEIEVVVSDFNLTDQFLKSINLIEKFYEENKRERYVLDNVEIDIDTWPMIPTYVELEGSSWDSVKKVAEKLGFNWEDHLRCSTMQIYRKYGIEENDYSVITFNEQIKK